MKFTGLAEILAGCVGQPWAIGAFDTINLEISQAIIEAAQMERAPVIIMVLPSVTSAADMPGLVAAIKAEAEKVTVPVALVLDHATSLEQVVLGLRLGFSGIMFDGSSLPLAENIARTRRIVELAHAVGVSVEAELGHVGGGDETGAAYSDVYSVLTRVEEAEAFVAETGADALAVSIGTAHGPYITRPELDFARLAQLRAGLKLPLVLHGGSGTPDEDTQRVIRVGIDKINVWTDVVVAYMAAQRKQLIDSAGTSRIHDLLLAGRTAARDTVREKIRLFGSSGKAI